MLQYFWLPFSSLFGYWLYTRSTAKKQTSTLYGAETAFKRFLRDSCPTLEKEEEAYQPSFWCLNSFFMSIVPYLLKMRDPKCNFEREVLLTPDGGQISLDWYCPETLEEIPEKKDNKTVKPVALFLAGLTGDSHSENLRAVIRAAARLGYRSVVLNNRGLGRNELLTERLFSALSDDDLSVAVEHIRKTSESEQSRGSMTILASGYSQGANILTRYLRRQGVNSQIDAAFLLSPCFDFVAAELQLSSGFWPRLFNLLLVKMITGTVLRLHQSFYRKSTTKNYHVDAWQWFTSLEQFDEAFTAPNAGFSCAHDYYVEASNVEKLKEIAVPTLALCAADDLIQPVRDLPLEEVAQCTGGLQLLLTTTGGGHVGFLEGPPWRPHFYADRLFEQFARGIAQLEGSPKVAFQ